MPLLTWVSLLFWKASVAESGIIDSPTEAIMSNALVGKAIMANAALTTADLTNAESVSATISNEIVS